MLQHSLCASTLQYASCLPPMHDSVLLWDVCSGCEGTQNLQQFHSCRGKAKEALQARRLTDCHGRARCHNTIKCDYKGPMRYVCDVCRSDTTLSAIKALQCTNVFACACGSCLQHIVKRLRCMKALICYAVTLKPDKTSAASEALKESLRTEGALLELVQAVQYHAEQSMPAATSSVQAPGE